MAKRKTAAPRKKHPMTKHAKPDHTSEPHSVPESHTDHAPPAEHQHDHFRDHRRPEAREGEDVVRDAPPVVDPPKVVPTKVDPPTPLAPHEKSDDPSVIEKRGEEARRKAQNGV